MKGAIPLLVVISIGVMLTVIALPAVGLSPLSCEVQDDCPGTSAACFCSNFACKSCGTGKICSGGACISNGTSNSTNTTTNPCNCTANMTCANGMCLDPFLPPYKNQCTGDSDCVAKLSDEWMCINGVCVTKPNNVSSWVVASDVLGYTTCTCNTTGVTSCSDSACDDKEYSFQEPVGASSPPFLVPNLPPEGQEKCLYSVEIHDKGTAKNDLCADDKGAVCAGPVCNYGSGFLKYAGPTSGCVNQYSSTNRFDATKFFFSVTDKKVSLQKQYSLYAEDLSKAECGSDTCGSRSASVKVNVTRLLPTKIQKCEYVNGSAKPSIVPLCNGTDDECTKMGAKPKCIACSTLNDWVITGISSSCNGPYKISNREWGFANYSCKDEKWNSLFGAYTQCAYKLTGSRKDTKQVLCQYGCTDGHCNPRLKPDLTSVTATPEKIGKDQSVEITSIAKDPNIIYTDASSGRQEKIRLECSTGRPNLTEEFSAICNGGTTPYVDVTWTVSPVAIQNVLRKYVDNSTKFETLVTETKPTKTTFRDTNVQFGHSYTYGYKPTPNMMDKVTVSVTPEACGTTPVQTGNGTCDAPANLGVKYQSNVTAAVNSYLAAHPEVAGSSASDSTEVRKYLNGVAEILTGKGFIAGGSVFNCQNTPTSNSIMIGNSNDQYAEHYVILSGSAGTINDKKAYTYREHANWQRCVCGGPESPPFIPTGMAVLPITGNAPMGQISCLTVILDNDTDCGFVNANTHIITTLGCTDLHLGGTIKNNCNGAASIKFWSIGNNQEGGRVLGPEDADFDTGVAWTREHPASIASGSTGRFDFTYDITKFNCGSVYGISTISVEGQSYEQGLLTATLNYGKDCTGVSGGIGTNCFNTGGGDGCPPASYPYNEIVCRSGGTEYPDCGKYMDESAAYALRAGRVDMYVAPDGGRFLFNKPAGASIDPATWQWWDAPAANDWQAWCDEDARTPQREYPGSGPTVPFSARCPDGSSGGLDYTNYSYCGAKRLGKSCDSPFNAMPECNNGPIQVNPHRPDNASLYCPHLFSDEKAKCSGVGGTVYDGTDGKWCGVIGSRLYDITHGYANMYIAPNGKRYLFFPAAWGVENIDKWWWAEAPPADDIEAWCNTEPDLLPTVPWPGVIPEIPWSIRCPDGSNGGIDYSKYQQCMYWKVGIPGPDQNPAEMGGSCLCVGEYAESNPFCTIAAFPTDWTGGEHNVYCRARDESSLYSGSRTAQIYMDGTPPTSIITSPAANSEQTSPFVIKVTDADDTALDKCFYYTNYLMGINMFSWQPKPRLCNKAFTVRIGPGGDCPEHGPCTLSVFANDTSGNSGRPSERTFDVKLIFTNITAPQEASYQTKNFTVRTDDILLFAANATKPVCTYDVYSISDTPNKTVNNSMRTCSGNFTVSIGPGNDCDELGEGACKIVSRIKTTINGRVVEDTDEKFYSIDWMTPTSTILTAPTGWVNSDITVLVEDSAQASVLTDCQYRVTSGGTETVGWTSRPCGTSTEPSEIKVTVGDHKQCKHEGGTACRVYVRPLGRNSVPGFGDNATISVMFNGNVTDIDGFSKVSYKTTYKGINFSGTIRNELRAAMFYVCNANSKLSDCIKAQSDGDTGVQNNNYCSGFMEGPDGKCELRCNDQTVKFYFVAKGQTLRGAIGTNIVVSPVSTAPCPTFRIEEINSLLETFYSLQEAISIQIMEIDTYIRLNGEDELANNDTLAMFNEALILTADHIYYMETAMQDLNVYVAEEIIEKSNDRLDEINALLRQIRSPTYVRMTVNMPEVVRYNTTVTVPVSVIKNGPTAAYGKIYCSIIKPGGIGQTFASSCTPFSSTYDMEFFSDRIGTWAYNCVLGRSIRPDCSFEVNVTPVSGTFQVMPGLGSYIESVSMPLNVVKGRTAVLNAVIVNPDDAEKYLNVRCDFTDSQGFMRRNTSACMSIASGESDTASVYMTADRLGNWTASRCSVFASGFEGCESLVLDNVSKSVLNYTVMLPTDVYIEALDIPGQMNNGTNARINALLQNPSSTQAYVTFGCDIRNPERTLTLSDRKAMDMGTSASFMLNITADVIGNWVVERCYSSKSTNPDYTGSTVTYTLDDPGSFDVIQGTKLYFVSYMLPAGAASGTTANVDFVVRNPSLARYAQVTCQYRNPLNSPSTASSECVPLGENEAVTIPAGIMIDSLGTWTVESCSVMGSISDDCSQSSVHDTLTYVGSFESPGRSGLSGVASYDIFIESISVPSSAYNNSRTHAIVTARNTASTSIYAQTGCSFVNPLNGNTKQISSCKYLEAGTKTVFALPVQLNMPGTWTVRDCYVNASSYTTCAYSSLYNESLDTKAINVAVPHDLFVSMVDAPDNNVVNNTEVNIGITISNPLADDRFGSAECTIMNPAGATQTKTTDCSIVMKNGYKTFDTSVFAGMTGTWIVSSCSVDSSTSTTCSGSSETGTLENGDTFDVIRGYSLQFSLLTPDNPSYIGAPTNIAYTVNNPSSTDRYGKVRCTATKGSQVTENDSSCFAIGRESFVSSGMTLLANSTGTWSLSCTLEKSFDAGCSSPTVEETANRVFEVTTPPDLFIQSLETPQAAIKNRRMDVIVKVRNLGLKSFYGTAGCTFKNAVNETFTNVTSCMNMNTDTIAAIVSYVPTLRGKLDIFDCYVNGATASDCSASERHNTSTITKTVTVTSPILTIEDISLASSNLQIGELLDIAVSVMNNDDEDHGGFVNCTVADPRGRLYRLTTDRQIFHMGETLVFHPQHTVSIAGRWVVQSCSVYRQDSPAILEDFNSVNQTVDVSAVQAVDTCSESLPCRTGYECVNGFCEPSSGCSLSNCPGTSNDACYCSGSTCVACGTGFICSGSRCVADTNIRTCLQKSECPEGMSCVNGVCAEGVADCLATEDCGNGLECVEGKCILPSGGLDPKITNMLIILLSAISVPIVLFIYIKRVI